MVVLLHLSLIYTPLDYEIQQSKDPYWNTTWGFFPMSCRAFSILIGLGQQITMPDCDKDPRFIIGIGLFVAGFIINRYADLSLRKLRTNYSEGYSIPHGCLFEVISYPNYFGAMLEWFGWALGTWSLAGLFWFLFSSVTFVPVRGIITSGIRINFLIIPLIEKLWYYLCVKKTDGQIIVKIPLKFPVKAFNSVLLIRR